MTPTKPKRCIRCKREIANVTTDGVELYVAGVAMPLKPLSVRFPCPHCGGRVKWNSERDRGDFGGLRK